MKCPLCSMEISQASRACRHCGHVFNQETYEKLSLYMNLQREMANLNAVKNNLQTALEGLTSRLKVYEKLLENDLHKEIRAARKKEREEKEIKPEDIVEPVQAAEPASARAAPKLPSLEKKKLLLQELAKTEKEGLKKKLSFEVKVGQKWLLIIGIITMLFGIGYFLKYAFDEGWIGPLARLAMAYAWGIILIVGGNRFRRKEFRLFGLCLIGGGLAVLYFSAFAGFQLYHLMSSFPSFVIMIIITVFATLLAVLFDTMWLAVLAILGGFLTPVLLRTGVDNQIVLMTYMTILNLGILGVAFYKRWGMLNILGFILTYTLYAGWYFSHYERSKFYPAIAFLTVFYLIYSFIPFVYHFFRARAEEVKGLFIVTPNAFISFAFSYVMIKGLFAKEWAAIVTICYSLVFALMALFIYKKNLHKRVSFDALLVQSGIFLIITVPIFFSGYRITFYWTFEAFLFLLFAVVLKKRSLAVLSYAVLALAGTKFLFYDYAALFRFSLEDFSIERSYTFMLAERLLTSVFLLLVAYGCARTIKRTRAAKHPPSTAFGPTDSTVILTLWLIVLFIVLNVETASFFHDYLFDARLAAVSALWGLYSAGLMIAGFRSNSRQLRTVSLILFLVTLLKVFIFDMAKFSTPYRIISFIILGLLLIATSYLYYTYKDRIQQAFESIRKA